MTSLTLAATRPRRAPAEAQKVVQFGHQPAHVGRRPRALGRCTGGRCAAAAPSADGGRCVARERRHLAHATQVPHRFVAATVHAHGLEIARAGQACQQHRIASTGLDPIPWRPRDRRRRHHFAGDPCCAQVPRDHEPARPSLADDVQPGATADQLAQRLVECCEVASNAAHMPYLAVTARLGRRSLCARPSPRA